MPLLQFQIDIDSDVHPELHAMLALIARAPARAERLRQLAAAGLIWEQLRAQGRSSPAGPIAETPPAGAAMHPAARAGDTRPADGAVRVAPRGDIPVLTDAVDEAALPVSAHAADADDTDDADAAVHLATGWGEPATPPARRARPRLLKMREKGLFHNGPDG